ncbi:MAG: hypothetical protein WD904_04370 [Dehalococcoidia bacterium]
MVMLILGACFIAAGLLTAVKPIFDIVADSTLKNPAIIPPQLPPDEQKRRRDLWRRYARWIMPGSFLLVGTAAVAANVWAVV